MPTDASPPETDVLYSHPSKRAWRRMEHGYVEIGPPKLPNRGYKDGPSGREEQCPEQNGDIHPAINLSVLRLQKAIQTTLAANDIAYTL